MSSITFNILNLNFPTPFRCIKILQEPIIFSSNINIDIRDIYPLLNTIGVKLHLDTYLHKKYKTHVLCEKPLNYNLSKINKVPNRLNKRISSIVIGYNRIKKIRCYGVN